ncbi:hypothetical protein K435DRAFT_806611 [Dendrothele bispora CBS 962.96]|uniref:Uncharacterized protein n=1 Tax=Dendrothele bispora (strain CBS 962.96) TaxID=1314807 RepID=A0A4S8L7P2_DENBC|nr:hypothetical protein K435DRAFT_806611 [Dendrothele bispora CBS 962.96]
MHTRHGSLGTVRLSRCLPRATENSFSFYVARLWEDSKGPRNVTGWLPISETKWAVEDLRCGSLGLNKHLENLVLIVEGKRRKRAYVWSRNHLYWELFEFETMRRCETEYLTRLLSWYPILNANFDWNLAPGGDHLAV